MKARYVAPVKTPATPLEVSRAYYAALKAMIGHMPSPETVAVLHAQCALETGNMASCWNWNVGNIKAGTEYEGLYTCIRLNERLKQPDGTFAYFWFSPEGEEHPRGNVVKTHAVPPGHPQTRMRAYEELSVAVLEKIAFLNKPHWRPAFELALAGDPAFYVAKVRQLGYFTAELGPYQRAVVSLFHKYLPIARGVVEAPPVPIEDDAQLCTDMAECMRFDLPDWLRSRVNVHVALGPGLDDYWADRKLSHDSDPTLPEMKLPDSDPPPGAA